MKSFRPICRDLISEWTGKGIAKMGAQGYCPNPWGLVDSIFSVLKLFGSMIFDLIRKRNGNWKDDTLSGLTVALALVPEAIAFSFIAGVGPLVGLWAAVFMGLITSAFGGRPGMISGATGAIAIVVAVVVRVGNEHGMAIGVQDLGIQYLFAVIMIAGLIQVLFGVLSLGRFIRLVPYPVMMGFVNGLAIVIFLSQLGLFKRVTDGEAAWIQGSELFTMLGLVGLTMAIMWLLPKVTKVVPAALAAIIVVAAITIGAGLDVSTVGSFIREGGGEGLKGGLPTFQIEIFNLFDTIKGHWGTVLSTAFLLAAVGLIESLMTLNLVDDLTETRGSGNRECIAQGSANLINGLFGGMGGCAMIGQSIINVNSGGRGRLSGIVAAFGLLSFILFGAPLIEQIPIAALVGVMFMVVIGTFAWSTLKTWGKVPFHDIFVIVAVTLITVFLHNLALAVLTGVVLSALVFAWESAKHVRLRRDDSRKGVRIYNLQGVLYFGSVREFSERLVPSNDPDEVIIDFKEARVADFSSLEALNVLTERYKMAGKRIRLRHLSPSCAKLIDSASSLVSVEMADDDPHYEPANF